MKPTPAALAVAAALFSHLGFAQQGVQLDPVQVTATRLPESVNLVPATISVVGGDELRARNATDLRTALQLVSGVEISPGGDSGPEGSVPAFYGFREFDAFLLVVDGVPIGGAFNPTLATIDLHNILRIEVLRGAAPVMYGATSFVGVIHILHNPAGASERRATAFVGDPLSGGASASTDFTIGATRNSITVDGRRDRFTDDRTAANRGHLAYRLGSALGPGQLRVDAEVLQQHQVPAGVTRRRSINGVQRLWPETSPDDNQNPSDARIDEGRRQLTLGYAQGTTPLGAFETTLAVTHTDTSYIRGFLAGNGLTAPQSALPADTDADGFNQSRNVLDVYYDAHFSKAFGPVSLSYGGDYLFGNAKVRTANFAYRVSRDGTVAESSRDNPVDERFEVEDRRNFFGAYVQGEWQIVPSLRLLAGLRYNETIEELEAEGEEGGVEEGGEEEEADEDELRKGRFSGTVGLSWQVWQQGADSVVTYADYRNSYKPLAFEFAPEVEADGEILPPETARAYEIGVKGALLRGRLHYDFSGFYVNFDHAKHYTADGEETGGGKIRFAGGEAETRFTLVRDLDLALNYAYHDARFAVLRTDDGTVVSGNRPELAPPVVAGLGLLYLPAHGFNASVISNYSGRRFLNKKNTGPIESTTTLDAHLGYVFDRGYAVMVDVTNATDERDAVSESEYSEEVNGAAYTRMQGRRTLLSLSVPL